jgi:hypothetical protein
MKKLYLVKREVYAESLEKACRGRGVIYEVCEGAAGTEKPEKKRLGFAAKKKSLSTPAPNI